MEQYPYIPYIPFFFNGDSHHRSLHSFPTRRSSDLVQRGRPQRATGHLDHFVRYAGVMTLLASLAFGLLVTIRSEEHTSELQSRGHIVCRLLLEKKKFQRMVHRSHI